MKTTILVYKYLLSLASVLCASAQSTQILAQGSANRPNIIYIMSDDHAYQAISAYGFGLNNTPHIDALANQGMLFTRAFVTNSICGPSRAVMLTGKHSHINGFKDNHSTFDGSQQTVAKLLRQAGYQTAVVGKWHLISEPQGFDYWNVVPGQGQYYNPDFIAIDDDGTVGLDVYRKKRRFDRTPEPSGKPHAAKAPGLQ